jgi:homotetrameric cytidine deaminase
MTKDIRLPEDWKTLVDSSRAARSRAWSPYSRFQVGAVIRNADGRLFTGCNVENASYGLTICAERVAMSTAVAAGATEPVLICVSLTGEPTPCGSCRQFLNEFNPNLLFLLDDCESTNPPECVTLDELLPRAFRLD